MLLVPILLGLMLGLGMLLLGVWILWFGNRKLWRLQANPLFIVKANLCGLAAVAMGGFMMVAVVLGGYQEYQRQEAKRNAPPPLWERNLAAQEKAANAQEQPAKRAEPAQRPQGFDAVQDQIARLEAEKEKKFGAARFDPLPAPPSAPRNPAPLPQVVPAPVSKKLPALVKIDATKERYLRALEPITAEVLTRDEHKLLREFPCAA